MDMRENKDIFLGEMQGWGKGRVKKREMDVYLD